MYLKKEDEIRIKEALKNKSIIICKEINELHYICDVIKNKYNIQCNNLKKEDKKTKNSGGSSMIEVYCTLIIKGVKTIEDVPLVIREQVIERLKQLEVPVK